MLIRDIVDCRKGGGKIHKTLPLPLYPLLSALSQPSERRLGLKGDLIPWMDITNTVLARGEELRDLTRGNGL